jgi:hypothetical protein
MIEEVLSYRLALRAQIKRVFLSLYPKRQDFVRCREAKQAIRDILGLDNSYIYGRLLTEVMPEIRYRKVHYAGRLFYRPKRRADYGKARQSLR